MKKFLFKQDGSFVSFVDMRGANSITFENQEELIEYFVEDNFEFDSNKKYSLVDGELTIEYSPMVPPPEIVEPELTPQQKLESAGLTVDELKELLGL